MFPSFLCTPTLCSLHLIGPQPYVPFIFMYPNIMFPSFNWTPTLWFFHPNESRTYNPFCSKHWILWPFHLNEPQAYGFFIKIIKTSNVMALFFLCTSTLWLLHFIKPQPYGFINLMSPQTHKHGFSLRWPLTIWLRHSDALQPNDPYVLLIHQPYGPLSQTMNPNLMALSSQWTPISRYQLILKYPYRMALNQNEPRPLYTPPFIFIFVFEY